MPPARVLGPGLPTMPQPAASGDPGRTATGWRRCGYPAIVALLVVLLLGQTAAFVAAGQASLHGDASVHWSLAKQIVAGDWLLASDPPDVTHMPGYPYFVAFFQATCGGRALVAAIVAQHLLLLANVVLAAWTCGRLTGKRSSVPLCLALMLACFSCHGVAVHLLSDCLLSFLLTLCIALAVAWRRSPSRWRAAALGLALGAAVMTKPVAQFAGLLICGWVLLAPNGRVGRPWPNVGVGGTRYSWLAGRGLRLGPAVGDGPRDAVAGTKRDLLWTSFLDEVRRPIVVVVVFQEERSRLGRSPHSVRRRSGHTDDFRRGCGTQSAQPGWGMVSRPCPQPGGSGNPGRT